MGHGWTQMRTDQTKMIEALEERGYVTMRVEKTV